MKNKHDKNRSGINRTDELINDYLQDVFGGAGGGGGNVAPETVTISKFFKDVSADEGALDKSVLDASQTRICVEALEQVDAFILPLSIQTNCFLVPTIKLLSSNAGNESYSKVQAILILLNALYFLRRPLPSRVRQCFLNLAEQMVDDYQFASFRLQMTRQGILA